VFGGSHLFHRTTRASSYKTLGESAQFLEKEKHKINYTHPWVQKTRTSGMKIGTSDTLGGSKWLTLTSMLMGGSQRLTVITYNVRC
jgi:hypothetical protein